MMEVVEKYDIRLGSPYNFLMMNQNPQCKSGIDRMTIGPDYRIFPCDAFKHILPEDVGANNDYSNIRNISLKECWEKSDYFKTVREYLAGSISNEGNNCSMLNKCNSGCMAQKFYAYGGLVRSPDQCAYMLKKRKNDACRLPGGSPGT